ncbi:MAG TPA: tetratricopeptide repeat protein [Sphingomicrobium sp.]|nr:tetratricopeptide repeat protein [Sphingomicrobium sp.]
MKGLVFAAGIAAVVLPLSAAQAAIITVGSGLARSCYEASEARDLSQSSFDACDRAFTEQALDRHDEVATHVNRGILYYLRGNFASARYDYDKALALDPTQAEAWLNKAMLELKLGDARTADAMFDRALELKTVRPALAYYGKAIINEDAGNVRQAYEDLQRARDLDPHWSVPAEELKRYVVR